ncbi:glycosyltransferase family 4 protein [Methanosarcina sp. UBA411]|jgi:glycosyltransferase involved in cell wall biosynthesis|uniref:glycosyltransferase family 4 protein n=1 Tax=Methanosarcina sp. UBA411 TaxID=1915589 RepID=UPI0025DA4EF8|nr:glycosyltransferase family 4 protein [Methanosarcina sp. UBA411]
MRILIISQHFPPEKSGNASRIFDMSNHLQKLGLSVTVLAPHPSFPSGSFKRKWSISESRKVNGVNVINLLAWQPNCQDPGFMGRIAYYLTFPLHTVLWIFFNLRKFDVIITSAPPIFTGFGGIPAKLLFKKKWVMDVRDLWINASISLGFLKKGSLFEKMSRAYEQICYSNADLICVTTEELGQDIMRTYKNIDGRIMRITPNGVDTDFFYPMNLPKKNQIIYAGNIGHAQDLEDVILAMKKINEEFDLKLLIVGNGDIKGYLEKVTVENGLTDYVEFPGLLPREDIPKIISESLIGVAPLKKLKTLEYAVPTKAYEYMACGIPFVGCGEGEIRKLAEVSGGGVIAENDPNAISDAILYLLKNPEKRVEMGRKGRTFVNEHYSRQHIAANLKSDIESIEVEKAILTLNDGISYAGSQ